MPCRPRDCHHWPLLGLVVHTDFHLSWLSRCNKRGEGYNIGGDDFHSIEEVAEIILRLTGARGKARRLVRFKGNEPMTTHQKKVDCTKARRHLGHRTTVGLEEGIGNTLAWMREAYRLK